MNRSKAKDGIEKESDEERFDGAGGRLNELFESK